MVFIFFLTTPTRAYEAYNINALTHTGYKTENLIKNTTKKAVSTNEMCSVAAQNAEKNYNIKENLLATIAMVESGKWDDKAGKRSAWPWTVHAEGKGYYFDSKEQAVAAVKAMQNNGITNIDVGCMQINLRYHGKAFKSLEDAFEPEKNVAYSAKFLKQLHKRNKEDWKKTAMHYHSKDWRKGINYKNRLEKHYAEYVRSDTTTTLF